MLSDHNEGNGREIIFSWNPSWLKNGDRRHHEAMLGLISRPYQVKHGIDRVMVIPQRSFLKGYYNLLQGAWNIGTVAAYNDTGGVSRNFPGTISTSTCMDMTAGAGTSTYGIVVGSNSTAVTREDTKLNTQVTAGATSSTLTHGACAVGAITNVSSNISQVSITRTLTGNAGSTVSILEDGIYVNQSTSNWKLCIERNISNFGSVGASQNVTITKNLAITT